MIHLADSLLHPAGPSTFTRFAPKFLAALLALSAAVLPAAAQDQPGNQDQGPAANQPPPGPDEPAPFALEPFNGTLEYPTAELADVVLVYQDLTGEHVVLDASAQGTVSIVSNPKRLMSREEAVEFIKSSLLLNGFAVVPVSEGVVKILNWGTRVPPTEGVPTYTSTENLPDGEEVINFILQLTHITPEEAIRTFAQVVPNHPYGKITPVNNAGAIIITDNTPVVKSILEIAEYIDKPSARVTDEMIPLERADAEDVANIINEILSAQSSQTSSGGGRTVTVGAGQGAQALAAALQNPGAQAGGQAPAPQQAGEGGQVPDESSVIVQAVPRLNSILVIARPVDVIYIKGLIEKLDSPTDFKNFLQRQLRFIPVLDFLPVAADSLSRGLDDAVAGGAGGTGARGGLNQARTNPFQQTQAGGFGARTNQFGGGLGGNQFGGGLGGGIGGGSIGSAIGRTGSLQGTGQAFQPPQSLIVGKTLLIGDPQSNSLIVSGPPEQLLQIDELINSIDKRPRQVYISAIIAQVALGDDIEYGIDLLQKVDTFTIGDQVVSSAGIYNTITNGTGNLDPLLLEQVVDFTEAGLIGGGGLNYYAAIGELFNLYIRALENTTRFQVLARPSVYTANNSPARLASGERIPIPESQQSTVVTGATQSLNTSITYRDVVLSLEVVPLINSSDEVTLQVNQLNENVTGNQVINGDEIPIIATQQLDTFVNVPNGSIVVIGGLIQDTEIKTTSGLPLFAKIPILKHLTGGNTVDRRRTELLVFIQPVIIEDTASLMDANHFEARRTLIAPEAYEFAEPSIEESDVLFKDWTPHPPPSAPKSGGVESTNYPLPFPASEGAGQSQSNWRSKPFRVRRK